MYLGARLGAGPRDGLMTALAGRSGWSIRRTRTVIEVSALILGWMMGGTLGVGTIMFAVSVGPVVQLGMRTFGVLDAPREGPRAGNAASTSGPDGAAATSRTVRPAA
jgi:uncharacterized membrane protein YczE